MPHLPELGPEQLKALTHPLRVAMLRALRSDGPATATALAKRLGESSGATSYHLRQLEKHGFIEEVPGSGNGRDRWWRPAFSGHRVEPAKWLDHPEARGVVSLYEAEVVRNYAERAAAFVGEQARGEWGREWIEVAEFSDFSLRLTPAQLARLTAKLHAVVESFTKHEPASGEQVHVQMLAFPRRVEPFGAAE